MTVENGAPEKGSSRASVGAANASAAAKPLIDATQSAYAKFAVHAETYFEHWSDLVEEVKIEQHIGEPTDLSVADILASLPEAEVASESTGRARLRLPALRGQPALAEQCAAALGSLPGITRVQVSSLAGSILIFFDTREYPSLQDLLNVFSS